MLYDNLPVCLCVLFHRCVTLAATRYCRLDFRAQISSSFPASLPFSGIDPDLSGGSHALARKIPLSCEMHFPSMAFSGRTADGNLRPLSASVRLYSGQNLNILWCKLLNVLLNGIWHIFAYLPLSECKFCLESDRAYIPMFPPHKANSAVSCFAY